MPDPKLVRDNLLEKTMSDSVPSVVAAEVASAQEPWPEPPADAPDLPSAADMDVDTSGGPEPEPDAEELPTGSLLARVAGDQLFRLATVGQFGLVIVGGLLVVARQGATDGPRSAVSVVLAIALLGLGGLILGQCLRGFGALLHAQADATEAAGRLEQRLVAGLDRLVVATESASLVAPSRDTGHEARGHLAEIRHALRSQHWEDARALLDRFRDAFPDATEGPRLESEWAESRRQAARDLLAKVEAAREVNDPEHVLELRESLRPLLDAGALQTLDRDLVRWLMALIQKRLRTGTVRADVAVLAAKVAEAFATTTEGASLRASLPTLRRAAGLCARCGQPYAGLGAACPNCLATAAATAAANPSPSPTPSPAPLEDDDPDHFVMNE